MTDVEEKPGSLVDLQSISTQAEGEQKKESQPVKKKGGWGLKTFIIAIIIAVLVRSLLWQAFFIPSGSMEKTLLIGDYIVVKKWSYGYSRYSFPFGLFGLFGSERVAYSPPQRGDVVVFKYPGNPSEDFIKRVIGLPGDKIQVVGGTLYINDSAVKDIAVGSITLEGINYSIMKETLPGGKTINILKDAKGRMAYSPANNTGVFIVKPGHFFMMGDNRDYSRDSRFEDVGQVPAVNLVGKARWIFFSLSGHMWQVWKWNHIRGSRIFTKIS